jgi:uncharacterized protein (TIGR03435 family)
MRRKSLASTRAFHLQPIQRIPPPLFTAIQEQLGLKLEAGNARADVIVIDRLERPTPN